MAVQPYLGLQQAFDRSWIEDIILTLGDAFQIRVVWDNEAALVATGACALVGGLAGAVVGGRLGAALGAGLLSAAGVGLSVVLPLRQIWTAVREQLEGLVYIVVNFLRQLDAMDYVNAFSVLMASRGSRAELAITMVEFIACKLSREVLSSITAG